VNNLFAVLAVSCLGASSAWAEGAGPASGGGLMMLAPWIAILGVFYFLLIRPQQKQAKEHQRMIDELKRGDRILTQGGLYGTVQAIKGKVIELKVNDSTKVNVDRGYVAKVVRGDPSAIEPEIVANGAK
jgi:preprotein translocase subunit YajC